MRDAIGYPIEYGVDRSSIFDLEVAILELLLFFSKYLESVAKFSRLYSSPHIHF